MKPIHYLFHWESKISSKKFWKVIVKDKCMSLIIFGTVEKSLININLLQQKHSGIRYSDSAILF